MLETLKNIAPGKNDLTHENGKYAFTKMDSTLMAIPADTEEILYDSAKETALLLLTGDIELKTETTIYKGNRACLFKARPFCLHVPANTQVTIKSKAMYSELLVIKTTNHKIFDEKFYTPEMVTESYFGDGVWEETAKRKVRDIFNFTNAPFSNLVLGEIINMPGRWSSYTPHWHRQPEIYFYKFSKPQGFGVSIIGGSAHIVRHNSFAAIPGGLCHPQVSAPGYTMYYTWAIRHLEGDPWNERIVDPAHDWLNAPVLE